MYTKFQIITIVLIIQYPRYAHSLLFEDIILIIRGIIFAYIKIMSLSTFSAKHGVLIRMRCIVSIERNIR